MEPNFQTSFIPKQSITPGGQVSSGHSFNIFLVLAFVVFLVAALTGAGAFFYKQSSITSLKNKESELANARQAFSPALMEEFRRLNRRIENSKKLLAAHLSPSTFFSLLEAATLNKIYFTNFTMTLNDRGEIEAVFEGSAEGFTSIALQSDLFGKQPFLKNPIFSDFTLDKTGRVNFKVAAQIDNKFVNYATKVESLDTSTAPAKGDTITPAVKTPSANLPKSSEEPKAPATDFNFEDLDKFIF
jgi:hypothetical protein